ncbi:MULTISPECIES: ABC transporter substrate-binding protein [unclassified Acidovorax]|uniref:ABC transporter substrate-binding protein n=1 Tax=unclassified Acidovorax TaxID=2684926 RepID=UPI0028831AE0|nr:MULTISPECIES: ABC transporter substrate-binding protein [unclassified Acidovorax]
MKQKPLWGRRQFSVGLGAAALAGFTSVRAQGDAPLVLGQSAALSGPAAQLGTQFQLGAKLYFDQYNAQSGRRPIELRTLDDGYEPERCAANTRKFIADDVFALFGYLGTATSLAALPLATQAKLPFFAPLTGAESLRQPFNRLVFHVRASYNDETALIARQLTNLHLRKIAVLHQNDAYGKAGLDGMTRALTEQQLTPVALATVERNSVDVDAAVKTLVAAKPEAIVMVCTYAAAAAFIRAARKAGYGGTFYNLSFVGTQALADALGKDGAGVVVSQVMPSPFQTTKQITREFQEALKKDGKVQANYSSMEGYLAARVFGEGLRRAGDRPTRDALINALEGIGPQGVSGFALAYGANSHAGSRFVEMSMLTGDGRVRV